MPSDFWVRSSAGFWEINSIHHGAIKIRSNRMQKGKLFRKVIFCFYFFSLPTAECYGLWGLCPIYPNIGFGVARGEPGRLGAVAGSGFARYWLVLEPGSGFRKFRRFPRKSKAELNNVFWFLVGFWKWQQRESRSLTTDCIGARFRVPKVPKVLEALQGLYWSRVLG